MAVTRGAHSSEPRRMSGAPLSVRKEVDGCDSWNPLIRTPRMSGAPGYYFTSLSVYYRGLLRND